MGQINLSALLLAAPSSSTDQSFPSGTTTIPFQTTPNPKPYQNDTGRNNIASFNSPSSYASLGGLGASNEPVSQAHTLYLRTAAPFLARLTFGSTVLAGIPIQGVFFMEFPASSPLVLVELQGSGAVEYYIAGNQ